MGLPTGYFSYTKSVLCYFFFILVAMTERSIDPVRLIWSQLTAFIRNAWTAWCK